MTPLQEQRWQEAAKMLQILLAAGAEVKRISDIFHEGNHFKEMRAAWDKQDKAMHAYREAMKIFWDTPPQLL